EHRLVERNGQRLLGAEADCVEELVLVVDRRDLKAPHTDAAACNAEPHTAARHFGLVEERAQRIREGFDIAELASADDAAREGYASDPLELRAAVVGDAGG